MNIFCHKSCLSSPKVQRFLNSQYRLISLQYLSKQENTLCLNIIWKEVFTRIWKVLQDENYNVIYFQQCGKGKTYSRALEINEYLKLYLVHPLRDIRVHSETVRCTLRNCLGLDAKVTGLKLSVVLLGQEICPFFIGAFSGPLFPLHSQI